MKAKSIPKRISAALLCLALLTSLLPVGALAADDPLGQSVPAADGGVSPLAETSDGIPYIDENGNTQNCASAVDVTSNSTEWNTGWYVVSGNVTISQRITVTGTVHLILVDGYALNASSGIAVAPDNSLTIYGQSGGTGKLTATGSTDDGSDYNGNAGIGGSYINASFGTITINGGIVEATGGKCASGIGGGGGGSYMDENKKNQAITGAVTINGGSINAYGGVYAPGIGASPYGLGESNVSVTINGGTVTAEGGDIGGAGIGSGAGYEGITNITINGGTVKANGGNLGAGIGSGYSTQFTTTTTYITINGGTVTATGGVNGAGIGCGGYSATTDTTTNITIKGGTVTAAGAGGGAGIGSGWTFYDEGTNTNITISGGTVTATGGGSGGAGIGSGGVSPDSSGANNATITITISCGTVTAAGGGNGAGIGSGDSYNGRNTFTTGDGGNGGNAVIFASSISDNTPTDWSGVIFQGVSGQVYGSAVTPTEDFEIPYEYTLEIPYGSTLTIQNDISLTNRGTITNNGNITNNGTIYSDTPIGNVSDVLPVPVDNVAYLDEGGNEHNRNGVIPVTANITAWGANDDAEYWYVVNGTVTIDQRIIVTGNVHLILADGASLTANGGINVSEGNSLTIYGQEQGTGTLNATGGSCQAGIGGNDGGAGGSITINGGTVTATGGYDSAGIGGGNRGAGGDKIVINGGTVYAHGGDGSGNALGGGNQGEGGTVKINGGTIFAYMSPYGSAIGWKVKLVSDLGSSAVITADDVSGQATLDGFNGIIKQENTYTVYGSASLETDLKIESGETLQIGDGKTLTISVGATLTNNGTIQVESGGSFSGSVTGNQPVYASSVTVTIAGSDVTDGNGSYSTTYGTQITITATMTKQQTNINAIADVGKVNFYLGAVEGGKLLGTVDQLINSNGTYTATLSVTLNNNNWTPDETPYTITADFGGVAGDTTGSGLLANTGTASLTVNRAEQTAPASGEGYTINYKEETITAQSGYELATTNTASSGSGNLELTPGDTATTVYIRLKETDTHSASAWIEVSIPARPAAPAVPSVDDKTDTSITITATSGVEYRLGTDGSWVTPTEGSYTFTGLSVNTEYTIYARYPAVTGDTPAFASAEATLKVTTKASAGAAPTVNQSEIEVTANSVTLPYDAAWEYSTDGTDWNSGDGANVFTNLFHSKPYTFYVRVAETTTAEASATATVTVWTAHSAPWPREGYSINYTEETISIYVGYEVNTAQGFDGTIISEGSITSYIGQTLYIRRAATPGGAPASASVAISIPARPAAPAVQGVNETVAGREDGKITGLTAGVDYEISSNNGQIWTDATLTGTEIIDLAPGSYQVRVKSTASSFSSEAASVTISTGATPTYTLNVTAPAFDSVYTGYVQPEAKAITISSAGNSDATISGVTVDNASFVIGGTGSTVPAGGSISTWTIQPAAGLSVGTYTATITVTYNDGATATATVSFTVNQRSGGSSGPATYPPTVEDSENGSVTISPRNPKRGDEVTITPDPDTGYEVSMVIVTDRNGDEVEVTENRNGTYTFTQPAGRVTIEVTFQAVAEEPAPLPFTDVPEGAWYGDAVRYVYESGLMTGTSPTTFSPDATTSRAMIVTILWRMAGSPQADYLMDFSDVAMDTYYTEAIRWASSEGIVGGYGNGLFGPNDPISREQKAVMLYRFAQHMGCDVTARADLSGYTDADQISGYAQEALAWANAEGLINGTSGTTLAPLGQATRAQAAVILERFCEQHQ